MRGSTLTQSLFALLLIAGVGTGLALTFSADERENPKPPTPKAEDNKPAKADKAPAGQNNDDPFGYTAAFDAELKEIGQITPEQFAKRYQSKAKYLDKISWDPTTAKFFKDYNSAPDRRRGGADFRLNPQETDVFKKNGFVVSERMGAASFAEMYYRIYSRDLPVYISSDSILHAWHRSYDAMLEELEETYLASSLDEILTGMAEQLVAAKKTSGDGVLKDSISDADYFIAVARSLLADKLVKTQFGADEKVQKTLAAVQAKQLQRFELFGRERVMDFSQFKVRGHYENSELLKRYFKAMMWCGRIDLRVAGGNPSNKTASAPRELGAAIVLHDLLRNAKKFKAWQQFDQMIQTFVGKTDSMTFAQLDGILATAKIQSPSDVKNLAMLEDVQKQIMSGKIGLQHVRSHYVESSPFGPDKAELPRSFTLMGQKFVMDSWATAKIVADDVFWDGKKVQRRVPSCLDVAFAALGNDQVVPLLVDRMNNGQGRKFRDGLNYQHNLAAVRNVIDLQDKKVWEENLYNNWLGTIRELSAQTTDKKYPEVMRTKAWAMKSLNTQLASWTQLRHDTILYVKQSFTAGVSCYYPAGYVEATPEFWARLEKMATLASELLEKTPYPDRIVQKPILWKGKVVRHQPLNLKAIQKKQIAFMKNFVKQVAILKEIAEKEIAQKEMTTAEKKFLEDVVQIKRGSGFTMYNGWYPGMFYKGRTDSGKWDAIVADVHTDVPAPPLGDPGCVLTQGVGNVDFMLIAIDNGKDKMVYGGPVLSHYEFEMPGVSRKSDSEWRKQINEGKLPPRPEWTREYLIPGENKAAKHYQYKP